ncbi:uncharacterized protein EAE97_005634 [Botrytis byssoidea]|uniref:Uncharacterized protein n=1 Tax=Botrytis byssoidea TaxID=139641 RepID=A0A9P5M029_9HELO|nr:uncharacterized protein EAE97_005634 [Botrytis byssoidea]KAF7945001.1 hypothetical protein EAE97_005634 [Botrytis byssoidea]
MIRLPVKSQMNTQLTTKKSISRWLFHLVKRRLGIKYPKKRFTAIRLLCRHSKIQFHIFFCPRDSEGDQRITWCCVSKLLLKAQYYLDLNCQECAGYPYVDFKTKSPENMRDIHAILHNVQNVAIRKFRAVSSSGHAHSVTNTFPPTSQALTKLTPKSPALISTTSTSSLLILSTPTSSVWTLSTSTEATSLEFCTNAGENLKKLGEINLVGTKLDEDMFKRTREKDYDLRGAWSKLWLLKPASVYFVRFSVEQRYRVGILQKPLSLPPEVELPVTENVIFHYLNCTNPTGILFWMRKVARKCNTSILDNGAAPIGIHIDEGPNYKVIFCINFVAQVIGGIIALAWSLAKGDFHGAFGFASWFIASVNAILLTLTYWLDEQAL